MKVHAQNEKLFQPFKIQFSDGYTAYKLAVSRNHAEARAEQDHPGKHIAHISCVNGKK